MARKNPYEKSGKNLYKEYIRERNSADVQKYEPHKSTFKGSTADDTTDNLINKYGQIEISNLRSTEGKVYFKAFITDYSETFESNWNSTEVFGRMDPIWTYQNTKRTIRLSFDVPSFDEAEAKRNLEKISKITRMMYPSYEDTQHVSIISEPPVFTLKFENLICRNTDGGPLKGIIPAFDFAPDVDQGFHKTKSSQVIPKTLKIALDFNVLHDHEVGYNKRKFLGVGDSYPYLGNGTTNSTTPTPPTTPATGSTGADIKKAAQDQTLGASKG